MKKKKGGGFDSVILVELFFANRNTPKKKVFYFLKAKVFRGKLITTVDKERFYLNE